VLALPKRRDGIGFTLVELLIVMAIIAILAGLLLAGVTAARRRAKRSAATIELKNIETALNAYRFDFNRFPPDYHLNTTPYENWSWDSGQCLVYYLGSSYRAGQAPTPLVGAAPAGWVSDRTAPAYFEFPATRIDTTGHFVDPWGTDGRDETGQVYYYQFDNNDEDLTKESWGPAVAAAQADGRGPSNWNMTNVHPQTVDIWSPGPAGVDHIAADPYYIGWDTSVAVTHTPEQLATRFPDMVGNW
jgi:prepilin-type N-terminal cleavage/methylation domain-containing protein